MASRSLLCFIFMLLMRFENRCDSCFKMVNTFCGVSGCHKEFYPGCGISFHRLPSNAEIRRKWLSWKQIIGRGLRTRLKAATDKCAQYFETWLANAF